MDEAQGKASKHQSVDDARPAPTPDELAPTESGADALAATAAGRADTPARAGTLADGDDYASSKLVASVKAIELTEEWRRLRNGAAIGIGVWIAFGVADWIVATWIHPGVLWPLLTIRVLVGTVIFAPGVAALYRLTPSRRRLRVIDFIMLQAAAWSIALMTVWTGGISSLYYGGVSLVMVIRTALIAEPWRKGLAPNFLMMASFPGVSLAHALVAPDGFAQFSESTELATFVINNAFLACIALFTIIGGDALWRARRQVFESRSIGRYRLIRRIGHGGMGEVWSAWHRSLKREVALKLLTERVDDPVYVARFEREVAATVSLSHPNTIRILDHGISDDGIRFYAMELLRGKDAGNAVRSDGALAVERAAYLLRQVAHSLAEAHAKGIYHRDVKPENIFITNDGRYWDFVKVLDFGIARIDDGGAAPGAGLTKLGSALGTPGYLSPEVARGERADARSDVFALGAVMFFMLTGSPPFKGQSLADVLYAHIHEPAPTIASLRGEPIPAPVEQLIRRALAKDPAERFRDAAEFGAALEALGLADAWRPASVSLDLERAKAGRA